jgi:16S rRNA (cytosine967-C5)-methyltransferase
VSGPPSARTLALEVFLEWDASRESADVLLSGRLDRARLPGRDRDLAAELVRGVFRWRGRLDWQLAHLVSRPLADLDPAVLWILRLGLYQLDRLDRIPPHAAVDTSVELAKVHANPGAAGLVNAVLRRAPAKLLDLVEPDAAEDPLGHLVARTSHPAWLLERWLARRGFRRTLELAAANNRKPGLTLRVASDRVDADNLIADLRARGIEAEAGRILPDTVRLPAGWDPVLRELLERGDAIVQDEAAGLVSYVGRPAGGLSVLDLCAAPGGKAFQFAALCGESLVVAADVSLRRLRALRQTAERTGERRVHAIAADGLAPATRGGFGRVLVDAPCTNTGVLAKRPDARWRRRPEDVPRLAALQGRLLDSARTQVGPGGLLVYSTCSLEPEENEDVIRDYFARHPGDALLPADEVLPDELVADGCLRVEPHVHGTDGAFAAAIRPGGASLRVVA